MNKSYTNLINLLKVYPLLLS